MDIAGAPSPRRCGPRRSTSTRRSRPRSWRQGPLHGPGQLGEPEPGFRPAGCAARYRNPSRGLGLELATTRSTPGGPRTRIGVVPGRRPSAEWRGCRARRCGRGVEGAYKHGLDVLRADLHRVERRHARLPAVTWHAAPAITATQGFPALGIGSGDPDPAIAAEPVGQRLHRDLRPSGRAAPASPPLHAPANVARASTVVLLVGDGWRWLARARPYDTAGAAYRLTQNARYVTPSGASTTARPTRAPEKSQSLTCLLLADVRTEPPPPTGA